MDLIAALLVLLWSPPAPPTYEPPAVHRPPHVLPGALAGLTVVIGAPGFVDDGLEHCGPTDLDLRLTRGGGSIGEVDHEATGFSSVGELRALLTRFKDARMDRRVVLVSVDDDVDHAAFVDAVDTIVGIDLVPHVVFTPPLPRVAVRELMRAQGWPIDDDVTRVLRGLGVPSQANAARQRR
ncbi:MAG TPA: hypothetical protein VGF99_16105 [Myxococcota bacterium]